MSRQIRYEDKNWKILRELVDSSCVAYDGDNMIITISVMLYDKYVGECFAEGISPLDPDDEYDYYVQFVINYSEIVEEN